MASVTELWGNLVGVAPVESSLGGTSEEMSAISSQGNRGDRAHNLGLRLDKHGGSVNLGDSTITSTNKHVTVWQKLENVDSELEESLGWSDSLVKLADKINLDNITSEGTQIGRGVIIVDFDALELTLDLTSVDVVVSNLLGNEVASPDSHTVVVDSDEFVVGVVEEFDLVSNVHTNGVTADSLA